MIGDGIRPSGNAADGDYETTPELTMRAFDRLPRRARMAISGAMDDWAVEPILRLYRKQGTTAVLEYIRVADAGELFSRQQDRWNGVALYEGNVPEKEFASKPK